MIRRVSVHGGHSGQFCSHAQNTLAEIVEAYIAREFEWVGITEHMPPTEEKYLFPEEKAAGLTVKGAAERFEAYFLEARRLQKKYRGQIQIFVAFETEAYPGAIEQALRLRKQYQPDYVLGSVHHVDGIPFDGGAALYQQAVQAAGGLEALYCRYFDRQYDLIQRLQPQVVGHFDLIRIFDPSYPDQLALPAVLTRVRRNLALIRDLDLILDYNTAALRKGADEPYVSHPLLDLAKSLGIAVAPSDDSHGIATVGIHIDDGIRRLIEMGFDTRWRRPASLP